MPGKSQADAAVAEAPPRHRPKEYSATTFPRTAAEAALDAWSRPAAWEWLNGRWALSGTLMGVPVAPPGDTLRLAAGSDGVAFEADPGEALPVLSFGDDGRPVVRLGGLTGDGTVPALRAVSATRRSVTFQDAVSSGSSAPVVLKVTLRRAGKNIFHVVGDTAIGQALVPLLAYTALKLNVRG